MSYFEKEQIIITGRDVAYLLKPKVVQHSKYVDTISIVKYTLISFYNLMVHLSNLCIHLCVRFIYI